MQVHFATMQILKFALEANWGWKIRLQDESFFNVEEEDEIGGDDSDDDVEDVRDNWLCAKTHFCPELLARFVKSKQK